MLVNFMIVNFMFVNFMFVNFMILDFMFVNFMVLNFMIPNFMFVNYSLNEIGAVLPRYNNPYGRNGLYLIGTTIFFFNSSCTTEIQPCNLDIWVVPRYPVSKKRCTKLTSGTLFEAGPQADVLKKEWGAWYF